MTQDDFFTRLDDLLDDSRNDPSLTTPSSIITSLGAPTASITILDRGTITTHCTSSHGATANTLFRACPPPNPPPPSSLPVSSNKATSPSSPSSPQSTPLPPLASTPTSTTLLSTLTISHLLSHTAGLNVSYFPSYPSSTSHQPTPTSPSTIFTCPPTSHTNTLPLNLSTLPGLAFTYSGGGTFLLQAIMEHVTSTRFPDLMRPEVFEPLGMTRSFYNLDENEEDVAEAWHHNFTKCREKWHTQPEGGGRGGAAAGLWTTVGDLARLVRGVLASLQGTGGEGERLLEYEMAKAMLTKEDREVGVANGWFVNGEATGFQHSGSNFPGWACIAVGLADFVWNRGGDDKESAKAKAELEVQVEVPKGDHDEL